MPRRIAGHSRGAAVPKAKHDHVRSWRANSPIHAQRAVRAPAAMLQPMPRAAEPPLARHLDEGHSASASTGLAQPESVQQAYVKQA
eukprot:6859091-Alexandrium_andersonii.AAC.1